MYNYLREYNLLIVGLDEPTPLRDNIWTFADPDQSMQAYLSVFCGWLVLSLTVLLPLYLHTFPEQTLSLKHLTSTCAHSLARN